MNIVGHVVRLHQCFHHYNEHKPLQEELECECSLNLQGDSRLVHHDGPATSTST